MAANEATNFPETQAYSKKEVQAFLADIAEKVVDSHGSYLHSILALNHLMRLPNASELFDEALKEQGRDLWLQLKSVGLQITDPPLLFGAPDPQADGADARKNNSKKRASKARPKVAK